MENKQTAVEWLEKIVISMIQNGADLGDDYPALLKHIEQAKEMEKKQIKKSFSDGAKWELYGSDLTHEERTEQYYNETFKG